LTVTLNQQQLDMPSILAVLPLPSFLKPPLPSWNRKKVPSEQLPYVLPFPKVSPSTSSLSESNSISASISEYSKEEAQPLDSRAQSIEYVTNYHPDDLNSLSLNCERHIAQPLNISANCNHIWAITPREFERYERNVTMYVLVFLRKNES
jgi:hypothetical protein